MLTIVARRRSRQKIDSETLAHLFRAGLLPESYVPPRDIWKRVRTVIVIVVRLLQGTDVVTGRKI